MNRCYVPQTLPECGTGCIRQWPCIGKTFVPLLLPQGKHLERILRRSGYADRDIALVRKAWEHTWGSAASLPSGHFW